MNLGLFCCLASFFMRLWKFACLEFIDLFGNTVFSVFGRESKRFSSSLETVSILALPFFEALIVILFLSGSRFVHSTL